MRTSNPTLKRTFIQNNQIETKHNSTTMTENGTFIKTAFLTFLVILSATVTWLKLPDNHLIVIGSAIIGLILSLIIVFKPKLSPVLAPIYAITEGVFLGIVSHMYNSYSHGLVTQAILATLSVLVIMLSVYKFEIIKVTNKLRKGVIIATGGVFLFYMMQWIVGFFAPEMFSVFHGGGLVSVGVSLLIVGIASFNLLLDFNTVTKLSHSKAPKYMEWYGAFALMVTLVWLYLEMLRLISKLNRN